MADVERSQGDLEGDGLHPAASIDRRRRIALAVSALLATAALGLGLALWAGDGDGQSTSGPGDGVALGVVGNALDGDTSAVVDRAHALGLRLIREELRWSEIEPARGTYHWGRTDRVFGAAARRGVRVLPILFLTPRWLSRHATQLPPSLGAWQAFVTRAVRRYGAGGSFWQAHPELDRRLAPPAWEVWNEPWLRQFSYPAPDPRRYAHLVVATHAAVRATGSTAPVLASMTVDYVSAVGTQRDWVGGMKDVPGLRNAIDAIAVHPYTLGPPDVANAPMSDRFDRVDAIESALGDLGVGQRPMWVTEVGWSTCSLRPRCVSRKQQADDVRRLFALVRTRYAGQIRALVFYDLQDLPGGAAAPESNFGLLDLRGVEKPAAKLIRAAANRG